MTIHVRVLAAQAMRQVAMMNAGLASTAGAFASAGAAGSKFGQQLNGIRPDRFGSRMQYLGRQLEYSFTLPIIAAGAAATHWAFENEKALTRVKKVYGDATRDAEFYKKEVSALERAFVALSNAFGVNQAEVINIAADWAAAGASGLALAKATELTLQTMVLGEMEAKAATKALIAIQAQYGLSTEELTRAIGILNMVENQTGASLADLIDGFSRAAGVARSAGIDVRNLAAMMAALIPAAGTAAQAGNALKTIFSRLLSPTKEAKEVLGLMNINIDDMAWKSVNVSDRLLIMARAFRDLSDSQKGVVSAVVASRWQINKFEVLMRELLSDTGFYARALDSTTDKLKVYNQMHKELNAVLSSNPRKMQIIWTMLQNAMADIIQPMIPLILAAASAIQTLFEAFSELHPGIQKVVLVLLTFLALGGPLLRYLGAVKTVVVELSMLLLLLGRPFTFLASVIRALMALSLVTWIVKIATALVAFGAGVMARLSALSAFLARWAVNIGIGLIGMAAGATRAFAFFVTAWPVMLFQMRTAVFRLWVGLWQGLQGIMIAGAAAIGIIWRGMHAGLLAFTRAFVPAMYALWLGLTRGIFSILFGFAAFAGGIFRAMYLGILASTLAFGTALRAFFVGLFTRLVPLIRAGATALAAAFSGPWGWVVLAIVAVIALFYKQIAAAFKGLTSYFKSEGKGLRGALEPIVKLFGAARDGILRAFNALPKGIRNALIAVVRIVHAAVMKVYELMSYLNPFARHSPSLVENVTAGMAAIRQQYASVANAGKVFADAGMDLEEFGKAVREIQRAADAREWAELRKELEKLAPSALGSFDRLVAILNPLKDILLEIGTEMRAQQTVVDGLKAQLDQANIAYEEQDKILQQLTETARGYQDQLDEAKQRLEDFASAPIAGMKEMADAIFDNQMEQKALQLQMMQMEDAVGPLDKLKGKIDAINGAIELLRGEQTDLRQAGAGSDIIGQYDEQISLLQEQQQAIEDQVRPIQELSDAIDDLGRKGQMLDLENSLKFDPLKKQIDDVANSMRELPFDEIMAGITEAKEDVDRYTASLAEANAAVEAQQAIVDQLKSVRDELQATYDLENAKLQEITDRYREVEERIRAIEQAFRDVGQAAREASGSGAMSPGAENFLGAAGGDFPDVGGMGGVGREGGLADQAKEIDDFTKEMANRTKNMFGLFNFMEPVKKGWNTAIQWLKDTFGPSFAWIGGAIAAMFSKMPNPLEGVKWSKAFDALATAAKVVGGWLRMIWELLGPEIMKLIDDVWPQVQGAFEDVGIELMKLKDLIGPMMGSIKTLWTVLGPVLGIVLALILLVIKALLSMLAGGLGPFIRMLGEVVAAIIKIISSLIGVIANVLSGNWKAAWDSFVNIFIGAWELVVAILKGVVTTIWGLIKGLVEGIVGWFQWLFDVLVGHSIIPDMINLIMEWFTKMHDFLVSIIQRVVQFFKDMWNNGIKPVFEFFKQGAQFLWEKIRDVLGYIMNKWQEFVNIVNWARGQIGNAVDGIKNVINTIIGAIANVWNSVWGYINNIVNAFNDMRHRFSFGDLFGGLRSAFSSAMNWIIGKWNNLSFGVGDFKIGTPNIPFMARGGIITDQPMAIVGEGRKGFPEYVIPTDPNFRDRAVALFLQLGKDLGMGTSYGNALLASILAGQQRGMFGQRVQAFASGGILGRGGRVRAMRGGSVIIAPTNKTTNITLTGDLSFPNVRSGDDVEIFIRNLEALIGT